MSMYKKDTQDSPDLANEVLILQLLETQRNNIEVETKRIEVERKRMELQQEVLQLQQEYNKNIQQIIDMCKNINHEATRAAPFYPRTSKQLHIIETSIEQICNILLHCHINKDNEEILNNIKQEIKNIRESQPLVPPIKIIGSINAEQDVNVESNVKKTPLDDQMLFGG